MNRLIRADFARLFKNTVFYVLLIGFSAAGIIAGSVLSAKLDSFYFEDFLYGAVAFMGLTAAVFVSLFTGTEYSDGTIRNKLTAGHSRVAIYLAHLIVCCAAVLIVALAYVATMIASGAVCGGRMASSSRTFAFFMLCALLVTAAYVTFMNCLSWIISSRAISSVICIIAALAFLFAAAYVNQRLAEPETKDIYIMSDEAGVPTQVETVPNPSYVEGRARETLEFINDVLPSGQGVQMASVPGENWAGVEAPYPVRWICCSLAFCTVMTGAGLLLFKRKEIR